MTIGAAQQFFLGASKATGGGAAGYQIERSLRFNSSDGGFCSRTPAVAGNRRTWTWAGWVKRSKLGEYVRLFNNTASGNAAIQFMDSDKLRFFDTSISLDIQTTQVFRDASAWYHLVIVLDTVQGTPSNRAKIYVNGVQVTTLSTATYPSPSVDGGINNNNAHQIGSLGGSSEFFNGYLADIHFIDGQALTPSSFTEVSATTGQLIPKAYAGTYTGNSFWLKFNDNSAATATTLGKDSFLLGNNWTPNNLSVTAGAGNDSLVDTPTSYGTDTGAGGEVRGNYCTWNPLAVTPSYQASSLTNGNLDAYVTGSNRNAYSTIAFPVSGKYFFEVTLDGSFSGAPIIGVSTFTGTSNAYPSSVTTPSVVYNWDGTKTVNGSTTAYGATYGAGAVIGVAVDIDSSTVTFYKNGSSQGLISLNVAGAMPHVGSAGATGTYSLNAGARPFAHTAPSGFKALCDTNLPTPVVAKPNTVMDVKLYTGNGAANTITGLAFSPDFVWIKGRGAAYWHELFDVVRGVSRRLFSNDTAAEDFRSGQGLTAFNADGFSLTYVDGNDNGNNGNGSSFVAWAWDAGTTTVSNTQGSITSQVRANASAGFSVATWTGTGSGSATVGHGLGVAPRMMIVKDRSNARNWLVYHTTLGATSGIGLNSTNAASGADAGWWNNTSPTSTVATIGTYGNESANYVGYFWTPVVGYSSFGSYTGNGSADGPFVFTGHRSRWLMVKRSDAGLNDWYVLDTARSTYNVAINELLANSSSAENPYTGVDFDLLSNGFKIRATEGSINASGGTFIYASFAESPLQYARAR